MEAREEHDSILTLSEAATELRCSRAHLSNILSGRVHAVPVLPVFRLGRRILIRRGALASWLLMLERRENEEQRMAGFITVPDDPEIWAGA
jgi:hypothetical protein